MANYDTGLTETPALTCDKCKKPLVMSQVTLSYMDNAFPVELPCCLECGQIYIPEELALGKMLHVEKSLEDK